MPNRSAAARRRSRPGAADRMSPMTDTLALAHAFLVEDPDPDSRAALETLLRAAEQGDTAARRELDDRFAAPLEFGTAGLRGRVEAGLARMNRLVVIKATWGLGTWLIEEAARGGPDPRTPRRRGRVRRPLLEPAVRRGRGGGAGRARHPRAPLRRPGADAAALVLRPAARRRGGRRP